MREMQDQIFGRTPAADPESTPILSVMGPGDAHSTRETHHFWRMQHWGLGSVWGAERPGEGRENLTPGFRREL